MKNIRASSFDLNIVQTWNKHFDLATSHFVISGECELFVHAEEKNYRGENSFIMKY